MPAHLRPNLFLGGRYLAARWTAGLPRLAATLTVPPVIWMSRCHWAVPSLTRILWTPGASWMVVGALPTNMPSTSMSAPFRLAVIERVAVGAADAGAVGTGTSTALVTDV